MKILYEYNKDPSKYSGPHLSCDELTGRSPGVFLSENWDAYVLVKSEDFGEWMHRSHGRVNVVSVHFTGEIRWQVGVVDAKFLSARDRMAVEHFDVYPHSKDPETWIKELEESQLKLENLSENELITLKRVASAGGCATIVESMRFTDENGQKIDIIKRSDEIRSASNLAREGLLSFVGSSSGTGFFEKRHIYTTKSIYEITLLGKQLLGKV